MNILLVSPRTPSTFWSFTHVLPFISKKAAFPPLGLITVAAMLPRDWCQRLVDLNVTNLTDAQIDWADAVLLSAMIVHDESARAVIERCRARGKPVVAGGPLFTTGADRFPEADCCVLGEAESIMGELAADLASGRLRPRYRSKQRPDLSQTPIPRWDLLDFAHYATMSLQFSRGCPFNCEFCDITAVYGRVPRVKTPGQMVAELDALQAAGWRGHVFIVDDNFVGNKVKVKALLRVLIDWRKRTGARVTFTTEASMNLADDEELLDLMVRAGFKRVFVGIESPHEASLRECAKVQNTRRDLVATIRRIHRAGMEVMGGFIVGFDQDDAGIFERQRRFIQQAGVVTAMVGLLTALPGTRLFTRLTSEGRIVGHSTGNNVEAVLNFVPALNRQTLVDGYRSLVRELYTPRLYYRRILTFLRDFRPKGPRARFDPADARAFVISLWILGVVKPGRREYWAFLARAMLFHRRAFVHAMSLVIMGHHFRMVAGTL